MTDDFMIVSPIVVVAVNHRNAIRYLRGASKYLVKKANAKIGASVPAISLKLPFKDFSGDAVVQPLRFNSAIACSRLAERRGRSARVGKEAEVSSQAD
jgi:hypothetical protein